jgi:hypothetical protein
VLDLPAQQPTETVASPVSAGSAQAQSPSSVVPLNSSRSSSCPDDLRLDELGLVAAALALLRGRCGHLAVGRHLAAVHDRPAVDPVDRVEQGRPLGEAGLKS